jgi:5'-nucleotidase
MTIAGSLSIKQLQSNVWLCNGTPVDCVIAVISGGIPFKPDVVVSGINAGVNVGTDIVYSGTAAAARQGALSGLPSIALSLCDEGASFDGAFFWESAAQWSAANLDKILANWQPECFVNVNMPNMKELPLDYEMSFPSRRRYIEKMHACAAASGGNNVKENGNGSGDGVNGDGWQLLQLDGFNVETEFQAGSDYQHVAENKISLCRVYLHPVAVSEVSRWEA